MCGRYVRRSDKQRIAEYFRSGETVFDLPPDYNVAPTTFQPVIRLSSDTGERKIAMMRWGLVPSWHKDAKHLGMSAINAQAEWLMEKPMWQRALQKRRCLVPADAFYEWQKLDAKNKQPYAFGLKSGEPFAFAGLWERWIAPDGKPLDSFAIITTHANEIAAKVHTRMPVIVESRDYTRWLTVDGDECPPVDLLRPCNAQAMKMWKVGSAVGNVRNNHPSLCAEIS